MRTFLPGRPSRLRDLEPDHCDYAPPSAYVGSASMYLSRASSAEITVREKSARPWKTTPSGGSQRERFTQVLRHRHALTWRAKRSFNPWVPGSSPGRPTKHEIRGSD